MDGYIIIYSDKPNITKINHMLFGRISHTKNGKYYYPGLLETRKYIMINKGCYFTERIDNNLNGKIKLIKANLDINKDIMGTARDHWNSIIKRKNLLIRNI